MATDAGCIGAEVLILSAVRTPVGNLNGALSSLPAHQLGSIVIREGLERAGVKGEDVSEVILGQILTAGTCVCVCVCSVYV